MTKPYVEWLVQKARCRTRTESRRLASTLDEPLQAQACLADLKAKEEEIGQLEWEVREWICPNCKVVYPPPEASPTFTLPKCTQCGDIVRPHAGYKISTLQRENEELREAIGNTVSSWDAENEAALEESISHLRDFIACIECGGYNGVHRGDCARQALTEQSKGPPLGPDRLVGALHDTAHKTTGKSRPGRSARAEQSKETDYEA